MAKAQIPPPLPLHTVDLELVVRYVGVARRNATRRVPLAGAANETAYSANGIAITWPTSQGASGDGGIFLRKHCRGRLGA